MGCEYGHVMQAKIVVDDSEAEEVVIIWRRVPSRGQNHMVGFELSMEPIKEKPGWGLRAGLWHR